jgi:hypothetical protein
MNGSMAVWQQFALGRAEDAASAGNENLPSILRRMSRMI